MQQNSQPEFIAREILRVERGYEPTLTIEWAFTTPPLPTEEFERMWATLHGPEGRNVRVNPAWLQVYGMPEVGDYWLVNIMGQVSLCKARTFKLEYEHIAGWRYRHLGKKVWVTTNPDRRTTTWRRMKREMGITHS